MTTSSNVSNFVYQIILAQILHLKVVLRGVLSMLPAPIFSYFFPRIVEEWL